MGDGVMAGARGLRVVPPEPLLRAALDAIVGPLSARSPQNMNDNILYHTGNPSSRPTARTQGHESCIQRGGVHCREALKIFG